jgi:hypothetical protein
VSHNPVSDDALASISKSAMYAAVYPSRAIGWSDTFLVTKPGGEPLSRIASRGSTRQAPSHAGDGTAEPMLA